MWSRIRSVVESPFASQHPVHWSAASSHDSAVRLAALWLAAELGDLPHALYVRSALGFDPVQVSGMAGAPRFGPDSRIEAALQRAGGAVATRRSHRGRRFDAALRDGDRRALRAIGADAVVPLSPPDAAVDVFVLVARRPDGLDPDRLLATLEPIAHCLARLRLRAIPAPSDWRPAGRTAPQEARPERAAALPWSRVGSVCTHLPADPRSRLE